MKTVTRFWGIAALCLMLALALGMALPAGHAAAQATGTVTSMVISMDNVPLGGVKMAAYTEPNTSPNRVAVANATTDDTGHFSMTVPAGTIWVAFLTQDIRGQSFWGYDNKPITVAAGQMVTDNTFVVAIRIVSEPQPAATPVPTPMPTPAPPPPGMPTTGMPAVPVALPLVLALAAVLLAGGLGLRRVRA